MKTYTPEELRFAATARCPCGAGLAYPLDGSRRLTDSPFKIADHWDCSGILMGTADPDVKHTAQLPFAFYEVKGETQPSANGATTRPVKP